MRSLLCSSSLSHQIPPAAPVASGEPNNPSDHAPPSGVAGEALRDRPAGAAGARGGSPRPSAVAARLTGDRGAAGSYRDCQTVYWRREADPAVSGLWGLDPPRDEGGGHQSWPMTGSDRRLLLRHLLKR